MHSTVYAHPTPELTFRMILLANTSTSSVGEGFQCSKHYWFGGPRVDDRQGGCLEFALDLLMLKSKELQMGLKGLLRNDVQKILRRVRLGDVAQAR